MRRLIAVKVELTVNGTLVRSEVLHELDPFRLLLPELQMAIHTACDEEVGCLQTTWQGIQYPTHTSICGNCRAKLKLQGKICIAV